MKYNIEVYIHILNYHNNLLMRFNLYVHFDEKYYYINRKRTGQLSRQIYNEGQWPGRVQ